MHFPLLDIMSLHLITHCKHIPLKLILTSICSFTVSILPCPFFSLRLRLSILCPLPVPVYEQPSEEPGPLIPDSKGKGSSLSSCAQSFDELTSEEQEEISDVCQDSSQDGYEEVKRKEKKEEKKEDREKSEEKEEEKVEREKKKEERENSRVLTIPVKSVSCGDFHTAALTHTDRLYTWGSLSQLTGGPYKCDATVSLKGSPLQVTA